MKNAAAALVATMVLCGAGAVTAREKPREAEFPDLSKRFLKALQTGKLADCQACWLSVEQMQELMASPPEEAPKPSAEELKKLLEYFRHRVKVVAMWFPELLKVLEANGADRKQLTYVSSNGFVRTIGKLKKTSSISMVFGYAKDKTVTIRIDDGFTYEGKWYFTDKPLDVSFTENGKVRYVTIEVPEVKKAPDEKKEK